MRHDTRVKQMKGAENNSKNHEWYKHSADHLVVTSSPMYFFLWIIISVSGCVITGSCCGCRFWFAWVVMGVQRTHVEWRWKFIHTSTRTSGDVVMREQTVSIIDASSAPCCGQLATQSDEHEPSRELPPFWKGVAVCCVDETSTNKSCRKTQLSSDRWWLHYMKVSNFKWSAAIHTCVSHKKMSPRVRDRECAAVCGRDGARKENSANKSRNLHVGVFHWLHHVDSRLALAGKKEKSDNSSRQHDRLLRPRASTLLKVFLKKEFLKFGSFPGTLAGYTALDSRSLWCAKIFWCCLR